MTIRFLLCILLFSWTHLSHASATRYGIEFQCTPTEIAEIEPTLKQTLQHFQIDSEVRTKKTNTTLHVFLKPSAATGTTLSISRNPRFKIMDDVVILPTATRDKEVETVSKKEILLALLYPGRLTTFSGEGCKTNALNEHIELRQWIVTWTQDLEWRWPDGGYAEWNELYWDSGTPLLSKSTVQPSPTLADTLMDTFKAQDKYSIGCYTASKLVYTHAILDYYTRVNPNETKAKKVESLLMVDGEPLVDVEPSKMWYFEDDYNPQSATITGKVLKLLEGVKPDNFVPGDWSYLRNTDIHTQTKIGYEGSNAIYLGRNKFDDYYNDHNHSYTYERKLDEVYQWRNKVFSRARDAALIEKLSPAKQKSLRLPPKQGGLVETYRAVPLFF